MPIIFKGEKEGIFSRGKEEQGGPLGWRRKASLDGRGVPRMV